MKADYAFAAHQLEYWNGIWITNYPLPTEPWLTSRIYRSWYAEADPIQGYKLLLKQMYIKGDIRKRYERLWSERHKFYQASEMLPQTCSHFDSQYRNLFIRKGQDQRDELVLLDWAKCGLGPLGAELNWLIAASVDLLEQPASKLAELESAAFDAYLNGLKEAGWLRRCGFGLPRLSCVGQHVVGDCFLEYHRFVVHTRVCFVCPTAIWIG